MACNGYYLHKLFLLLALTFCGACGAERKARNPGDVTPLNGTGDQLVSFPLRSSEQPGETLIAHPSRTFSFVLTIPPKATLSFSHAAEDSTLFWVRATVDGATETRTLYSTWSQKYHWDTVRLGLDGLSNRLVRLDFETLAPDGAGRYHAAWHDPSITVVAARRPGPVVLHGSWSEKLHAQDTP